MGERKCSPNYLEPIAEKGELMGKRSENRRRVWVAYRLIKKTLKDQGHSVSSFKRKELMAAARELAKGEPNAKRNREAKGV
jgi:hypothetical protein